MNELIADPKNAQSAIDTLTKRGYDTAAVYRFACAARSWSTKDSEQWKIWREVEKLTAATQGAS